MPNGEFRYMLLDKVGCNSGSGLEDEPPGCGSIRSRLGKSDGD
jgi:hypothetical protein